MGTVIGVNQGGTGGSTASEARTALDVEQAFTKNTGFNKNLGTGAGEVLEGSKDAEYARITIEDNIDIEVSTVTELLEAIQTPVFSRNVNISVNDGVYDLSSSGIIYINGGTNLEENSINISGKNGLTSVVELSLGSDNFQILGAVSINNAKITSNASGQFAIYQEPGSIFGFQNLEIVGDTTSHAFTGWFGLDCSVHGEGLIMKNFDRCFAVAMRSSVRIFSGDIGINFDNTGLGTNIGTGIIIDDGSFARFTGDDGTITGFDEAVNVETDSHLRMKNIDVTGNDRGFLVKDRAFLFYGEDTGTQPKLLNNESLDCRGESFTSITNAHITSGSTSVFNFMRAQDRSKLQINLSTIVRDSTVDGRWAIYIRANSQLNWDSNNTITIGTGVGTNDDIARIDLASSVFDKSNTAGDFDLQNDGVFYGVDWD